MTSERSQLHGLVIDEDSGHLEVYLNGKFITSTVNQGFDEAQKNVIYGILMDVYNAGVKDKLKEVQQALGIKDETCLRRR